MRRQRTANSPVPTPYSPNTGIAQDACGWSVRGDTINVAVWGWTFGKCPPFLYAKNVWSFAVWQNSEAEQVFAGSEYLFSP